MPGLNLFTSQIRKDLVRRLHFFNVYMHQVPLRARGSRSKFVFGSVRNRSFARNLHGSNAYVRRVTRDWLPRACAKQDGAAQWIHGVPENQLHSTKQVTIHVHSCILFLICSHSVRSGTRCSRTALYASATCCIMPSRASKRASVARR
jgi:hypothetical protein